MYSKAFRILVTSILSVSLILTFFGCGKKEETVPSAALETTTPLLKESESENVEAASDDAENKTFSQDEIDTYVILNDNSTAINGDGCDFENGTLMITKAGVYSIKGKLSDGQIVVNSSNEDKKVKLYFDGVDIYSSDSEPVVIASSPKETVIILAQGSVNNLSDNQNRVIDENAAESAASAVIYSKDDLQIEGKGTLNITADFAKGIFSKDDIKIKGEPVINITSADDAIRGKDRLEISGGTIAVKSSGDGLRTSNEEKGDLLISGASISITSRLDGIQSAGKLEISAGDINITAGGGAGEITDSEPSFAGFKGIMSGTMASSGTVEESTSSSKALKAEKDISISGGSIVLDCFDDAVHSSEDVYITGGNIKIKTSDDAVHADSKLNISGGMLSVSQSYEGLEAEKVSISGATIYLYAKDDGINAASSDAQSENPAHKQQGDRNIAGDKTGSRDKNKVAGAPEAADSNCGIEISGGNLCINTDSDGIDTNGNLTVSGGTVIVYGPESGANGALDYSGSCTMTGGTLLAVGADRMAQDIYSDSIASLSFRCNVNGNTLMTVTDENSQEMISFISPKPYTSVVFACPKLVKSAQYNVYTGGSHSGENKNGVYENGTFTAGTLIGTYSAK